MHPTGQRAAAHLLLILYLSLGGHFPWEAGSSRVLVYPARPLCLSEGVGLCVLAAPGPPGIRALQEGRRGWVESKEYRRKTAMEAHPHHVGGPGGSCTSPAGSD